MNNLPISQIAANYRAVTYGIFHHPGVVIFIFVYPLSDYLFYTCQQRTQTQIPFHYLP